MTTSWGTGETIARVKFGDVRIENDGNPIEVKIIEPPTHHKPPEMSHSLAVPVAWVSLLLVVVTVVWVLLTVMQHTAFNQGL